MAPDDDTNRLFVLLRNDNIYDALVARVDVRAKDAGWGRTLLHWAAKNAEHDYAMSHPYTDIARRLITKGADVTARDHWLNTPLHEAAKHGCIGMVKLLIEKGADPNARNDEQLTPLDLAITAKLSGIVALLEPITTATSGHAQRVGQRRGSEAPQVGG